jgi:DNA-binding transcriptional MerR regulator
VRISELSRSSGVPVPTVKYYLREGLLPAGERTSANQARYGEEHLRRLRLVRVLVEVGTLSIAAVKEVLAAIDDDGLHVHELLRAVQYPLVRAEPRDDPAWLAARADVTAYVDDLGWRVHADAPALHRLADVLHGLRTLSGGEPVGAEVFAPYAALAGGLAQAEIDSLPADAPRAELALQVAAGVAVFEAALSALRLLAQEDASGRRYGTAAGPERPPGEA